MKDEFEGLGIPFLQKKFRRRARNNINVPAREPGISLGELAQLAGIYTQETGITSSEVFDFLKWIVDRQIGLRGFKWVPDVQISNVEEDCCFIKCPSCGDAEFQVLKKVASNCPKCNSVFTMTQINMIYRKEP